MMSSFIDNADGTVTLLYEDAKSVIVSKADFDRAFGTMCNASRDDVLKEFGVKTTRPLGVID